eukprot:7748921-Pyramimonas_sp.AAC.1
MLHNTNIRAKYQFADPIIGVPPSTTTRRRAQAADLTGHAVGGRCTSTTPLLHDQDDETKMAALAQQVKEWFHFWARHPELRDRVRLGWRAVRKRLLYMRPRARW